MAAHEISEFIDSIKESLTDGKYKEGMELCQKVFQEKEIENKLYRMTYLRPFTFLGEHCEDEECDDMKLYLSFTKSTALVQLTDARAERIREKNLFLGRFEDMKDFIDLDVLRSFPLEQEDLETELNWFEFPVISLESVT